MTHYGYYCVSYEAQSTHRLGNLTYYDWQNRLNGSIFGCYIYSKLPIIICPSVGSRAYEYSTNEYRTHEYRANEYRAYEYKFLSTRAFEYVGI